MSNKAVSISLLAGILSIVVTGVVNGEAHWPMFQHDPQHTGRSPFVGPQTLDDPETQIQTLIEGEGENDYFGTPVIGSDGTLYLIAQVTKEGQTKEGLWAFASDGSQKWVYEITSPFNNMPALWEPDSTVYIVYDGGLLAINSENGVLKWSKTGFSASNSQNVIVSENGVLYFVAGMPGQPSDWGLYALDDKGQTLWVCPIAYPDTDLTIGTNGDIYFGNGTTLFAIDINGTPKWQHIFEGGWPVRTPVVADDGTIYVIGGSRYSEKSGWRPCFNSIDPDNPEEGKIILSGGYYHTSPVISALGIVYIPHTYMSWDTFKTRIYGIDPAEGNVWSSEGYLSRESTISLIVDSSGTVYTLLAGLYTSLMIFDSQLELKWSCALEPRRSGPLSLGGDGTLYVGGQKKLYAIRPGVEEPPEPPGETFTFVHITDTHIGASSGPEWDSRLKAWRHWDAYSNVDATIKEIAILSPAPDFVLVTGDIADYGCGIWSCPKHYSKFKTLMDEKLMIPYYVVPGNHDRREYLFGAAGLLCLCELCCYIEHFEDRQAFLHNDFLFIGLDTGDGNQSGELSDPMPDWYRQGSAYPTLPKIVFMHHPGVDKWGPDYSIQDEDFLNWCDDNKVRLVLAGHTHQDHVSDRYGNPSDQTKPIYVQTPSCGLSRDWLGDDPSGYRIIDVIGGEVFVNPVEGIQDTLAYMTMVGVASPISLHVYDSAGRHVGIGPGGEVDYGIPDSFYHSHYTVETEDGTQIYPETINIFGPTDDYLYELVGTEEGTYRLNISSVSGGEATTFVATDIPTSPGARHVYSINWQALSAGLYGVTLDIDANGDGIFEQIVISDSELSYDEFVLQTETVIDFEPDTLNLKNKGKFVTVYIELPLVFDVSEIDISSLTLYGSVQALPEPFEIDDYDSDGITDLMVKFDRQELIELLKPGEQIIDLTGQLWDGRRISDYDIVRLIP